MDIVDDVFRQLHVKGRVTYRLEESGLWTHRPPRNAGIQLHCVLTGGCRYHADGAAHDLDVWAGDVLILPRGGAVTMHCIEADRPSAGGHARRRDPPTAGQHGRVSRVVVLGGELDFAGQTRHPLVSGLCDLNLVRQADLVRTGTKRHAGFLIDKALSDYGDTSSPILDRLFEILMIQVVNAHYASVGPTYPFMAALHDRTINRAITAIHEDPGYNWSLERLAAVAGLSRSVFCRRFSELADMPAMQYLTLWRMHTALGRLKAGDRDLEIIAREVGYLSPTAFRKAFKRIHGFTPAKATTA